MVITSTMRHQNIKIRTTLYTNNYTTHTQTHENKEIYVQFIYIQSHTPDSSGFILFYSIKLII